MCGRLRLDNDYQHFTSQFGILDAAAPVDPVGGANVCPTNRLIAVAIGRDGTRKLIYPHWGMIDPRGTKIPHTINAKAENVARSRLWGPLFRKGRRCLIAFDAFYEWQTEPAPEPGPGRKPGKPKKIPHTIRVRGNRAYAFAGLYSTFPSAAAGAPPDLCAAIITTEPNDTMRPLHHRMPAILDEDDFPAWLGETPATEDELQALLRPYRDGAMEVAPGGPFG